MRIFRKLFVHYYQLNMWLISVAYILTANFPNAGCARLQRAPIIDRVNDNFTIDFTVTFHPQPTWVGELRNTPHSSTRARLGGGNYVIPPPH